MGPDCQGEGYRAQRMAPLPAKPDMKDRILETADRLFYLQGIRAVGVDTIAAEIGISKRTLYNHFPSKDALICGLSGAPLRAAAPVRASRRSSRFSAPSIRWSGALQPRIFAAARSSTRSPNSAARIKSVRKIAIAFKESRRLWFRDLLVQLGVAECGGACDAACAAGRRLDRAGSGARRSRRWRGRRRKPQRCCWPMLA